MVLYEKKSYQSSVLCPENGSNGIVLAVPIIFVTRLLISFSISTSDTTTPKKTSEEPKKRENPNRPLMCGRENLRTRSFVLESTFIL